MFCRNTPQWNGKNSEGGYLSVCKHFTKFLFNIPFWESIGDSGKSEMPIVACVRFWKVRKKWEKQCYFDASLRFFQEVILLINSSKAGFLT